MRPPGVLDHNPIGHLERFAQTQSRHGTQLPLAGIIGGGDYWILIRVRQSMNHL